MCLLKAEADTGMLRDVAVCMLDLKLLVSNLQPLKDSPPHDVHEGLCSERPTSLCLEFDLAPMQRFMAGFAQGNEIVGGVSICASALKVMNLKYLIFAFAMAVLTRVAVTTEHVFARVPGAELFSLLILGTRDLGIPDELDVKGSRFNDYPCDWQEFQHILNAGDMCGNDVFDRGSKPALVLAVYTVVEAWRAIACLAIAPRTTTLPSCGQKCAHVRSSLYFGCIQFLLFCCCREADVLVAGIDTQGNWLFCFTSGILKLNYKRNPTLHPGLVIPQQMSGLGR